MFQGRFNEDVCFKKVLRLENVMGVWLKGVPRGLKADLMESQGYYKEVQMGVWGSFKGVSTEF